MDYYSEIKKELIDNEIMQSHIDLQILKTGSHKCNKSNKKWRHFYGTT